MTFIGWIGNTLLAMCAVPAAAAALFTGRSPTPWSLLIPWGLGEVLAAIYALSLPDSAPLLLNYLVNIVAISILVFIKVREEGEASV